ncbi:hypothetical protein GCM10023163_08740 [Aestuariibaculum suncheonense]
MTLYEFNILDFNSRMEAVNQYGVYLDNHITRETCINCYAIDKFFVEVYYNPESNKITKLRSFKAGERLNKYSKDFSTGF